MQGGVLASCSEGGDSHTLAGGGRKRMPPMTAIESSAVTTPVLNEWCSRYGNGGPFLKLFSGMLYTYMSELMSTGTPLTIQTSSFHRITEPSWNPFGIYLTRSKLSRLRYTAREGASNRAKMGTIDKYKCMTGDCTILWDTDGVMCLSCTNSTASYVF